MIYTITLMSFIAIPFFIGMVIGTVIFFVLLLVQGAESHERNRDQSDSDSNSGFDFFI